MNRAVTSPHLTDRAQKVLTLAALEATERGHDYISAEHILLAIIREETSVAAGVIEAVGPSGKVKAAIDFIIGRVPPPTVAA